MPRTREISADIIDQAQALARNARSAQELRIALAILLPNRLHLSTPKTGELLGRSRATVFRLQKRLLADGQNRIGSNNTSWGGRRRGFMELNGEKALLASFCADALKRTDT